MSIISAVIDADADADADAALCIDWNDRKTSLQRLRKRRRKSSDGNGDDDGDDIRGEFMNAVSIAMKKQQHLVTFIHYPGMDPCVSRVAALASQSPPTLPTPPRTSSLSASDHSCFMQLLALESDRSITLTPMEVNTLMTLRNNVNAENNLYWGWQRSVACERRLLYHVIPPRLQQYAYIINESNMRRVRASPREYSITANIGLTIGSASNLSLPQPLGVVHRTGTVPFVSKLPASFPCSLPNDIHSIHRHRSSPATSCDVPFTWQKRQCMPVVSRDSLARQLAIDNGCRFVIADSTLEDMVEGAGPRYAAQWEIPVTVESLNANDTMVFLDKPLRRLGRTTRDDSTMLHTHMLKAFFLDPSHVRSWRFQDVVSSSPSASSPFKKGSTCAKMPNEYNFEDKDKDKKEIIGDTENGPYNVTYSVWLFGIHRVLVRLKVHGCMDREETSTLKPPLAFVPAHLQCINGTDEKKKSSPSKTSTVILSEAPSSEDQPPVPATSPPLQCAVGIFAKMEYIPGSGFEVPSDGELARWWVHSYFRDGASILVGRINAYTSQLLRLDLVNIDAAIRLGGCNGRLRPQVYSRFLTVILDNLAKIKSCGIYIVSHRAKESTATLYRSLSDTSRTRVAYDLHATHKDDELSNKVAGDPPFNVLEWADHTATVIPNTFPIFEAGSVKEPSTYSNKQTNASRISGLFCYKFLECRNKECEYPHVSIDGAVSKVLSKYPSMSATQAKELVEKANSQKSKGKKNQKKT